MDDLTDESKEEHKMHKNIIAEYDAHTQIIIAQEAANPGLRQENKKSHSPAEKKGKSKRGQKE